LTFSHYEETGERPVATDDRDQPAEAAEDAR